MEKLSKGPESTSLEKINVNYAAINSSLVNTKVTYRATQLWQNVLQSFRTGVPLGKHRSLLRQYDSCFVANAAITWFHAQLQNKFDDGITRRQTTHLLQKFYKAGVFTPVTNQVPPNEVQSLKTKETDFKDNRQLYKLVDLNDVAIKYDESTTETHVSRSNPTDYYVIINQLSVDQVFDIWRKVFIERFVHVVGYNVFTTFLRPGSIDGQRIKHNMTEISSSEIVQVPAVDDLPGWVINAMRCVTRGLTEADFKHTNYPGFENDVFGLIRDYFNTFKDTAPLLTFELHDAFVTTFIRAALFNGKGDQTFPKLKPSHEPGSNKTRGNWQFMQEKYPFAVSDSTENLLLDMATPSPKKKNSSHSSQNQNPLSTTLATIHSPGNELDDSNIGVEPMPVQSYDIEKYKRVSSAPIRGVEQVYLETAFTGEQSPVTRIISKEEIEISLGALRRPSTLSINKPENTMPQSATGYENLHLVLSPSDLVNHPKYSKLLAVTDLNSSTVASSNSSFVSANATAVIGVETLESIEIDRKLTQSFDPQILINGNRPAPPPYRRPFRSHSAANLSDANQDRSGGHVPALPVRCQGTTNLDDTGYRQLLLNKFSRSPSRSAQKTVKMFASTRVNSPYKINSEGKEFAVVSFRLLTLLLPPRNRRYLQLLLKFMAKIAGKKKFVFDVANTTRKIVINEFSRAILGCRVEKEYDEYLAHQIVTFLMDYNQEVFDVSQEVCLKKEAEDQIYQQQIEKVPMTDVVESDPTEQDKENNPHPKFACGKVSLDEYENQRLLGGTAQSLRELLATCDALPDFKERKRQLKKFRKEYPHIYAEKYGDAEISEVESSAEVEVKEAAIPKKSHRIFRTLF